MAHAYQVVSDVQAYPHFVPWCISSNITRPLARIASEGNVMESNGSQESEEKMQQEMEAELTVGFKNLFTEKYTSHVTLFPSNTQPKVIAVSSNTHILDYLHTTWEFKAAGANKNHCWVNFKVDFQFKSSLYNQVSSIFMKEVVEKMVVSFEKRMLDTAKK
jgi:coenzyme Q-binding protein COQ10